MQQYGFCLVPHHSSLTNNVSFCPSPPLFVLAGGPSHVHQLRHRPPRPRSQRHAQAVEVAAHRQQPQRPGRQLTCWLAAPWAPPPSQDEGCQASPWIPPAPRPTSHGSPTFVALHCHYLILEKCVYHNQDQSPCVLYDAVRAGSSVARPVCCSLCLYVCAPLPLRPQPVWLHSCGSPAVARS